MEGVVSNFSGVSWIDFCGDNSDGVEGGIGVEIVVESSETSEEGVFSGVDLSCSRYLI